MDWQRKQSSGSDTNRDYVSSIEATRAKTTKDTISYGMITLPVSLA